MHIICEPFFFILVNVCQTAAASVWEEIHNNQVNKSQLDQSALSQHVTDLRKEAHIGLQCKVLHRVHSNTEPMAYILQKYKTRINPF